MLHVHNYFVESMSKDKDKTKESEEKKKEGEKVEEKLNESAKKESSNELNESVKKNEQNDSNEPVKEEPEPSDNIKVLKSLNVLNYLCEINILLKSGVLFLIPVSGSDRGRG